MSRYQVFITAFIVSIIAFVVFITAHVYGIFNLIRTAENHLHSPANPFALFDTLFSPLWIISLLITMVCSLLYKVLGIVFIARNDKIDGGEKALWIIGFVLFGFITAIVFMALCKSKNLNGEAQSYNQKGPESQI